MSAERLRELATERAQMNHWQCQGETSRVLTVGVDHTDSFAACRHPDCLLVQSKSPLGDTGRATPASFSDDDVLPWLRRAAAIYREGCTEAPEHVRLILEAAATEIDRLRATPAALPERDARIVHSSEIADDPAGFEGDYVPLEDYQAMLAAVRAPSGERGSSWLDRVMMEVRVGRRPSDDAFRFFSGSAELLRLSRLAALKVANDILELASPDTAHDDARVPSGEGRESARGFGEWADDIASKRENLGFDNYSAVIADALAMAHADGQRLAGRPSQGWQPIEEMEIRQLAERLESVWLGKADADASDLKRAADKLRTLIAAIKIAVARSSPRFTSGAR